MITIYMNIISNNNIQKCVAAVSITSFVDEKRKGDGGEERKNVPNLQFKSATTICNIENIQTIHRSTTFALSPPHFAPLITLDAL
jgi:hypothetical protein